MLLFFSLSLSVVFGQGEAETSSGPEAEDLRVAGGTLSLEEFSFEEQGPAVLRGEWEFYWKELLFPGDFEKTEGRKGLEVAGPEFLEVPAGWNSLRESANPAEGYATYRCILFLPEKVKEKVLAMEFPEQSSAFRCYVNGILVGKAGEVGKSREESRAEYSPGVEAFYVDDSRLEIVMQISNFRHRTGGFWAPISLGLEKQLVRRHSIKTALDAFLLGAILIMGIYHLVLFLMRSEEKAMFFFSLFCFAIALRLSVTGHFLLMQLFPVFPWEALKKTEFVTETLSILLFAMFLRRLFPVEFRLSVERGFQFVAGLYAAASLFLPVHLLIKTSIITTVLTALLGVYSVFLIIKVTIKKREGAYIFLVGIIFLFFGVSYDIIINQLSINSFYLFPAMLVCFFITQSVLLSGRFAKAFSKAERQLENFLLTLASAIESKDEYTGGHVERVANYARDISGNLHLTPEETRRIYLGAIIHDIGKLAIPDSILNKNGKLTTEEFDKIKEHTIRGKQLLDKIEDIETAAEIALYHQERWDGGGYPMGITKEDIPLSARITALADYWDAITTDRPYRKAMPLRQALHIMYEEKERAFDPGLFEIFMKEKIFVRYLNPRQQEEYRELQTARVVEGSSFD